MTETTNKDLLNKLIRLQKDQSKDIIEIKTCLLGDKYHPNGLVSQVKNNEICITNITGIKLPALEKEIDKSNKRTSILGGGIALLTIIGTTFVNWIIFKK